MPGIENPQPTFIAEVFHDLSQPLTALQCTLELSLRRDETPADLRASIQTALENAERLRQRLLLIRALSDADDPGTASEPTELNRLVRDLHEDMLPLFESEGRKLELQLPREALVARINGARLTRALFCFLEYLFRYSAEAAATRIELQVSEGCYAELRIVSAACPPISPDDESAEPYSCELEMTRRTFRAAGGNFLMSRADPQERIWSGRLALA